MNVPHPVLRRLPGLALCAAVAALATALATAEAGAFGHAWLEPLVLSIAVGAAVRTMWTPSALWRPGIEISARTLLEIAVALLGLGLSAKAAAAAGPGLIIGVIALVFGSIAAGYALGRALKLPPRLAALIACGNSICGNSAIAAVAPVIGADGEEVGSAIAFTAAMSVAVVLTLPVLALLLGLGPRGFGVFAGLTVYAVPQVLAATAGSGALAMQTGALVKLLRVLMLGPVVLALSLAARFAGADGRAARLPLSRLAPWFIIAFLVLALARNLGWVPQAWLGPAAETGRLFTLLSMAALGLGADLRLILRAGPRVAAVVGLSIIALGGAALGLIHGLHLT